MSAAGSVVTENVLGFMSLSSTASPLSFSMGRFSSSGSRNRFGINVRTLTEEIARQTGLEGTRGAFVVSVDPGSVADENGISQDDLIIEINNRPVASAEDFQRIIRELRSGDDVVIKVLHRPQSEAIRHAWIVSLTMP